MKIKPYSKKNNTNILQSNSSDKENNKEVGRSMVETLGVLAVIGVLSVGGIAGYQYAMNKYRSNELLNEASKRALIVVTQLAQGSNEISLEEFTENTYSGGTFSTTVTEWENQFAIEVSGVNQSVCKNLCMDVNGQENVSLAPVDNLETTLTADNCSDINALAFIFDKNLDDEIADDSDEEDDEDDTNKATYSCHNGTQIFKEDDFLANCTCEAGTSGKYASDEEAITAICEDGQINPDEYSCSGGSTVMKNGQPIYNGCYCAGKSGSYYTEEEALANMCHPYNIYHCYTGKGVYKNNESYLISNCSCYTAYSSGLLNDEEAISALCLPTLNSYYCTNGTQLNKNGTFFTNCPCTNDNGSGYYYTDEEAVSIMCISGASLIYYYCMGGHTLQRTGNNMTSCNCVSGQSGYYYSDSDAISAMCTGDSTSNEYYCSNLDLFKQDSSSAIFITSCTGVCLDLLETQFSSNENAINYMCREARSYICSGNTLIADRNGREIVTNCNCSYSASNFSLTDEEAISAMCLETSSGYAYFCSGNTLLKNGSTMTNCLCLEGKLSYYDTDEDAILNMCHQNNGAGYYYCSGEKDIIFNEKIVYRSCYNCTQGGTYYSQQDAMSHMCPSVKYYYCPADNIIATYEDGKITNCSCSESGYFASDEEAIAYMCK